ncbi:unnamed protein product, partial [Anisakis simplex]|uniref:L-fucose kinase (inferred by orthology to a human protein) n=1 Tax=Anisakis simplex TaxID=6269 RepID=A0A0M3KKG1_ANISI
DVVRKWFARDEQITATLESLAENAEESARLIQQGVFPMVQVERYYESKKRLAPGCEPIFVKKLIDDLKSAGLVEAAWLSGAGGGGFLCVWLMDGISRHILTEYLRKNDVSFNDI